MAQAKNFSVMAYISILSAPTSSIMGNVGLKPGVRSSITLDPIVEVSGGGLDIYARDDTGDKQILITTARQDLIAAYRDAAARVAEEDKAEVYHWPNGLSVASQYWEK